MEMIEGLCLLISGACLLTPGFITDTLGFLILIPPLRHWFALYLLKRFFIVPSDTARPGAAHRQPTIEVTTIEGEFRELDK
jgi:UPF0716 protein FxsA